MRKGITFLFAAIMLFMSSCATVFTGVQQTVQINSEPSAAKVQVDGLDRGETPVIVKLRKGYNGQIVTLKKDGYKISAFQPQTDFNGVAVLNLFNPLFWGIDIATGALWKYSPSFYHIKLEPETE